MPSVSLLRAELTYGIMHRIAGGLRNKSSDIVEDRVAGSAIALGPNLVRFRIIFLWTCILDARWRLGGSTSCKDSLENTINHMAV